MLAWLRELGYSVRDGASLAPDDASAYPGWQYRVLLLDRLRDSLERLNPGLASDVYDEALRKVTRSDHPTLFENNRRFHRLLADGVDVEVRRPDGSIGGQKLWLLDFEHPDNNDWLAVNQFQVLEEHGRQHQPRRPDVVLFVNGIPLVVFELKNLADEHATIARAWNQLQTYKTDIPSLFVYNALLVVSDGVQARAGSLTSSLDRFLPWRTIDGTRTEPRGQLELLTLVRGVCERSRFLDLVRNFVAFEGDGSELVKKVGGYHQFHAVNRALDCTLQAAAASGNRRIGVIWHTQGSGKSLTMAFFAGKLIRHPKMANPTIVVLTDRNDLDQQLFDTFCACKDLLRQTPAQAQDRSQLRELLKVASGGVVFTTLQKFLPEEKGDRFPCLSERSNIVVIADEAHRSQYDFIDGYARHLRDALPKASFIGFTGTPIETSDKNTRAVFGDDIHVYDIQQAVEDGATVPIYYEGRLAKIALDEDERPRIDPDFEEIAEGQELEAKEKLKSRWARLEAMVGTPKRLRLIAEDLVAHFEQRCNALAGKGMVVCMSRRICVDLYREIIRLRPGWHSEDDGAGEVKIVMTGSASDTADWQPHIRNKARRSKLARRYKDDSDPFRLVLVRDMWLTGFDAPSMHTLYLDKPMRGHGLLQAIARVNRVFRDKPAGLVVDYLGLADELKKSLAAYTESNRDKTAIPQEQAVEILLEKIEVVRAMFHGFDYSSYFSTAAGKRLALIPSAVEHILALEDGEKRYLAAVQALSEAFALSVPHEKALALKDEVGFFQAVRAVIRKTSPAAAKSEEELDAAVRQLVSKAVAPAGIVDIFQAVGMKSPDISILSDEFLAEVQGLKHRNLAVALMRKLLSDQLQSRKKKYLVQSRSFAEMLEKTLQRYQARSIETAAVIAEFVRMAKELREAERRGEQLGLTEDEVAFYDALEVNDSAVKILGDPVLGEIAKDLVKAVKANVSIDWTVKESVRAKLRVIVKRVLKKHGYPPDKQEKATQTVLEQAELLCQDWAA